MPLNRWFASQSGISTETQAKQQNAEQTTDEQLFTENRQIKTKLNSGAIYRQGVGNNCILFT